VAADEHRELSAGNDTQKVTLRSKFRSDESDFQPSGVF
jgi:hypothetical protein